MARDQQIELIENKEVGWAKMQQQPRAVLEVGSRACVDHPTEECSDIDF